MSASGERFAEKDAAERAARGKSGGWARVPIPQPCDQDHMPYKTQYMCHALVGRYF